MSELVWLFLRLGCTAFGGPAAHIAMMEQEVVRRRRWLTEQEFLDLLGAVQLIPGPNSTELAMHIGHRRRGMAGLFVAGTMFIVPAALITLALAWAYVRFGTWPSVGAALRGVKPVIIGVVVQAFVSLAPKAVRSSALAALGAVSLLLALLGAHELVVLAAAGTGGWFAARGSSRETIAPALWWSAPLTVGATAVVPITSAGILLAFAKVGAVLFGSGYVLLAFLRREFVERLHWLTESQLLDAITAGQMTPGPVFTTATFVGYLMAGTQGAVAATVGIFLPAFVFVALSGPLLPRLRGTRAAAFLDGINVASLALMGIVAAQFAASAITDAVTLLLAASSVLVLYRWQLNSTWLILGGALIGWAWYG